MVTGVEIVGHLFATGSLAPAPAYRAALLTDQLPVSVNPLIDSEDPAVSAMTPLLYRSLLRLDATAFPVPDLASSLSVSSDGLDYTLPLRSGLHWSDGKPITAGDALATIQWVQSRGFPDAAYASAWAGVAASASGSSLVLTVAAPRAALATDLAELPILPLAGMTPAQVGGLATDPATPLPSSGPYEVVNQRSGLITLTANPHAATPPHLGRIEIQAVTSFSTAAQAFQAGTVEAVLATTPAQRAQLLRRHGATARDVLTFGFVDLIFNEKSAGLDDPAVRRAIADTVDRGTIVSGPVGGLGAAQYGPYPAGILWLQDQQPALTPDDAAANAGLDDAGWLMAPDGTRAGGSGVRLSFTLSVPDAAPLPAVAQMVAAQLDAVGISMTVDVVPAAGFLSGVLLPGRFQMAIASWDAGADPDLSAFWGSTSTPPHGYNVSGATADPFLDQDLATVAAVSGQAARTAAAGQVVEVMAEDLPAVFLYGPGQSLVVESSALSNVVVPAAGDPFADAAVWRR
ncbi:MAG: ABC transporter substrate-binding protein [Candidatus Dormibacteria bacterium]